MEPTSTPRSTQRLVVSVGAGAEASIVHHTMLTDYVPCLFFEKMHMVFPLLSAMKS